MYWYKRKINTNYCLQVGTCGTRNSRSKSRSIAASYMMPTEITPAGETLSASLCEPATQTSFEEGILLNGDRFRISWVVSVHLFHRFNIHISWDPLHSVATFILSCSGMEVGQGEYDRMTWPRKFWRQQMFYWRKENSQVVKRCTHTDNNK